MSEEAYLDLLKRCLLNEIYLDDELRLLYLRECLAGRRKFEFSEYHDIRNCRPGEFDQLREARLMGQFPERSIHNSGFSHTMIGRKKLDNLHTCLDLVRDNEIEGDFVECGVWRGGACIFMAGYIKTHGLEGRRVFVADSFEGMPKPSCDQDIGIRLEKEIYPELAVSLEVVKQNFETYGLVGENITFLRGWFRDSLPDAPIEKIAVLRLDGVLYESTMDSLLALYDKVETGGVVIVNDYGVIPACRKAVEDFFEQRGETVPDLRKAGGSGVYWQIRQSPVRSFETGLGEEFLENYQAGTLQYTYRGIRCIKSPIDMAIYMKAIWELKPTMILEVGSHSGGSAVFFSDMIRSYGFNTHIYSVDLNPPVGIQDENITFIQGNVEELEAVFDNYNLRNIPHPWFINEDSAHTYEGCLAALNAFSREMVGGDLLAMEDGILDELGLSKKYNGGPNRAIETFMRDKPTEFEIATDLCDMFGKNLTYNPNGYLRKT